MATFTIEFSVADEHMDRIRYALRKQFGQVPETITETIIDEATGEATTVERTQMRDMTGEELLARVRQFSIDNIKAIVMAVEAEEAAKAARDAVSAVQVD